MSDQSDERPSLLDRVTAVLPWAGGAIVLLVLGSVVRSSLSSHDTSPPIAPTVVNRPVLPAAFAPRVVPAQSSLAIGPAAQRAPASRAVTSSNGLDTAERNPDTAEPGTPAPRAAGAITPSTPRTDAPSQTSPSYVPAPQGEVYVHGYTKKNGTYVQPHYRSAPDGIKSNNWSSKGNTNPHTGKRGTK